MKAWIGRNKRFTNTLVDVDGEYDIRHWSGGESACDPDPSFEHSNPWDFN